MDVYSYEEMSTLREDPFRLRVVLPLMKQLRYTQVRDWHGGGNEDGKDVICSKLDEVNDRENLGVVIKAVDFGRNAEKGEVFAQVRETLNATYLDNTTGEEHFVHRCWVITNKEITTTVNKHLRQMFGPEMNPRIKILDGWEIWELLVRHFSLDLSQQIRSISQRISSADSPFNTQVIIGDVEHPIAQISYGALTVVIGEKYPGQIDETSSCEDDAPAAQPAGPRPQEDDDRWDYRLDPSRLPQEVLDTASAFLGVTSDQFSSVKIPQHDRPNRVLVSLDLHPEDGESVSLTYIDMIEVSRNERQTVFTNEHQPIPTLVTMIVRHDVRTIDWNLELRQVPVAAPLYLQQLKLLHCLGRPGEATGTIIDPSIPLGRTRYQGLEAPQVDPETIAWAADLATVQTRTGIPIFIPNRDFTDDEMEDIHFLRFLLRNPVVPQTWSDAKIVFLWSMQEAEQMLASMTREPEFRFRAVNARSLLLFGSEIPLGRVEQVFTHTIVANADALRQQQENATQEEEEYTVVLAPGSTNSAFARHLDWGALTQEEEDARQRSVNEDQDFANLPLPIPPADQ